MTAGAERSRVVWLLPLAMAAAWPIANLLHNNWSMLIASDLPRAALWWLGIFASAAGLTFVASRWITRWSFPQYALAAAIALVGLFLFEWAVPHIGRGLAVVGIPARAANLVYPLLVLLTVLGVGRYAGSVTGRKIVATFIVVGSGSSLALVGLDIVRSGVPSGLPASARPYIAPGDIPAQRPNVLMVMMDGYARADVLSRIEALDNTTFLDALRARGFTIVDRAVANYPVTYLSLSSMLAGDYLATPEHPPYAMRARFYDVIQGNNPVVASFRGMGYTYVHSGNVWGGSSCSGREDVCLNSVDRAPTREIDLDIMQMTPFRLFLPSLVAGTARGDLRFILRNLDVLYRRTPVFFFAHTIPPHPPFEWNADCSKKKRLTTLEFWSSPDEYRDNILCVNREALKLADSVIARDSSAILVFFSDHGSAFLKPFAQRLDTWSDAMIAERFPTFVAIRAPAACTASLPQNLTNVNLGRFLVACVSGHPVEYRPDRFFTSTDERHADFGRVHEITPRVEATHVR
jgi:hypothetical protein